MDNSNPTNWPPTRAAAGDMPFFVRLLATLALVVIAGTFVATEVDFIRRHRPGISIDAYLLPQAKQILGPGIGLAAAIGTCAAVAALLHRRNAARG